MEERVKELYALPKDPLFKNNKYEYISADFNEGTTQEFYEKLIQQFGNKDVSILVNNVGMRVGSMEQTTIEKTRMCAILNTFPNTMLTQKLLPIMEKRPYRSAVISLSSMNVVVPFGGRALYGAAKTFDLVLSQDCSVSFGGQIDWLCVKPAYVSTPLNSNRKIDTFTCDLETCAVSTLKCLGNVSESYGAKKHVIMGFVIEGLLWIVPEMVRQKLTMFIAYKVFKTSTGEHKTKSPIENKTEPKKEK